MPQLELLSSLSPISSLDNEELRWIELCIARRADELLALHGPRVAHDYWLQAQEEVMRAILEQESNKARLA